MLPLLFSQIRMPIYKLPDRCCSKPQQYSETPKLLVLSSKETLKTSSVLQECFGEQVDWLGPSILQAFSSNLCFSSSERALFMNIKTKPGPKGFEFLVDSKERAGLNTDFSDEIKEKLSSRPKTPLAVLDTDMALEMASRNPGLANIVVGRLQKGLPEESQRAFARSFFSKIQDLASRSLLGAGMLAKPEEVANVFEMTLSELGSAPERCPYFLICKNPGDGCRKFIIQEPEKLALDWHFTSSLVENLSKNVGFFDEQVSPYTIASLAMVPDYVAAIEKSLICDLPADATAEEIYGMSVNRFVAIELMKTVRAYKTTSECSMDWLVDFQDTVDGVTAGFDGYSDIVAEVKQATANAVRAQDVLYETHAQEGYPQAQEDLDKALELQNQAEMARAVQFNQISLVEYNKNKTQFMQPQADVVMQGEIDKDRKAKEAAEQNKTSAAKRRRVTAEKKASVVADMEEKLRELKEEARLAEIEARKSKEDVNYQKRILDIARRYQRAEVNQEKKKARAVEAIAKKLAKAKAEAEIAAKRVAEDEAAAAAEAENDGN